MQSEYYKRESCRMCDGASLLRVMSLKETPPGNDLITKQEIGRVEKSYPLDLNFCEDCFHVQLGHVVNPKILYQKNYSYVSSTSQHFVKHLSTYAQSVISKFGLKPKDLVVDIGSNDGTCLSFFKEKKINVVGIDPAKEIAEKASKNGIPTIADFFGYDLAINLRKKYGSAKHITSHNACAHIDNLIDVVKGVEHWLSDDGVFVLEVGYFADVYTNTWFDTIYHEHLDYHTVAPFEVLLKRVDMEIIDVERIDPQGGSIRLITQKCCGIHKKTKSVEKLIEGERQLGLYNANTLINFESKIIDVRKKLQKIVYSIKKEGKNIAGFGAPTKATTLMAQLGLDENILDFIVDDNPLKQGLFTPVTHIPILSSDALYENKPDYVLILAWNFAEPIMKMHHKYNLEFGKFIIPMPEPRIIS
jgi:hypothetical protein